ncbi:MAG: PilZ domain-containing protein [Thermoanaerobaculia bacterium]
MASPRPNRRRAERIRLSRPLVCRLGTDGVVLIDVSNYGARVEHYAIFTRGHEKILRIRFGGDELAITATVVSSRLERFIPGEKGLTVYRSGLRFLEEDPQNIEKAKKLTSALLAGTLVEQVANARGFIPPQKGEMPIFRDGALTSNQFDIGSGRSDEHLLPRADAARKIGFIRFSFDRKGWTRKWTLDPHQPQEGFTVSANETWEQIESLCELYRNSDAEGRAFIRVLAQTSIENELGMPHPSSARES